MNMWSLLSLLLGAIYLIGFTALIYCAKCAPEGYEGSDGFRLGREPAVPPLRHAAGDPAELDEPEIKLAKAA